MVKTNFKIISIKNIHKSVFPVTGQLTVRGKGRGGRAKTSTCLSCSGVIAIGEQYFNLYDDFGGNFCIGCVDFTDSDLS